MAEYELAIKARRAVTPDGVRPVTVAVRAGKIAAVAAFGDSPDAARVEELPGREILLPGPVNTHVHVNEPGRTEWEGFASATRAAAEGGVTTLIDMRLNCLPPTTTTGALRRKQAAARGGWVDVGLWGGAVPGNPIRGSAHRDGLWGGLADGLIDVVVSDHSPCPPSMKQLESGDFGAAWGGISSLQLGLPAVWTQARQRGHGLADVARWMAAGPAALAGLPHKGVIAPGYDADLVAFDDEASFTVDPARLRHRHPVTPYAGRALTGVVRRTWLRGQAAGVAPAGRLLTRAPDGEMRGGA